MRYIRLAAALLALAGGPAHAHTWYVNSITGSDSNDGKSLGTPFLTPNHADAQVLPGDTVDLIGYFAPCSIPHGGTAGNVVTWQSYYQSMTGYQAFSAALSYVTTTGG